MDMKRLALLFIVAFIGATLWQRWQIDYPAHPSQQITAKTAAGDASVPVISSEDSDTAGTSKPRDKPSTTPSVAQTTPKDRLVRVKTDLLDVAIDTKGGNLVSAKLLHYSESLENKALVQILSDSTDMLYVAQSGLVGPNGPDTRKGQVQFQAANKLYELQDNEKQMTVDLTWRNDQGVKVTKQFTFTRGSYVVKVNYQIVNGSTKDWRGHFYAQFQRKNLAEKSKGLFYIHPYRGGAISSPEKPYEKISYKKMDKNNLKRTIDGGWLAMQEHYFLSSWIPKQKQKNHFYSHVGGEDGDVYTLGMYGPNLKIPAGGRGSTGAQLYVGPEVMSNLKDLAPGLHLTIDYGWLWFISIGIFWVMQHIYNVIGNWGWSIVLVTVFIKLAFYRLSAKSYTSMAKMRKLQPRLEALKKRHGDDKQAMGQATIELYRKEKVNPMGGCLPILIQIPVFIALYWVLIESVQLRQAPFILWIHDLSIPDPFYVLPILMGLTMLIQQKLNPPPPDPTQAKVMMVLPVVFTFLFLYFPAGLVLYWVVNNGLSILQQWYITYSYGRAPAKKRK